MPIIEALNLYRVDKQISPSLDLLLDPSTVPLIIKTVQNLGMGILSHLFYMTRTWCFMHHSKRKKLLKLYNII